MQIIIPMSGFGERFFRAGYQIPKALIELDGKPIIAHVIDMFPGEHDFLFICNNEHLQNITYRMEEILHEYCPTGKIIGIPPHKLGPVHAVLQVHHLIDMERPALINYCDFTCYWDWNDFKNFVVTTRCQGAIPAYKGFHPHSLGNTNYAYMQEQGGWVSDIQEKQPYTNVRMNEYASSGSYYFASGKLMIDALRSTIQKALLVGGEYYVSLAYKALLEKKQPVAVYPLQHFMQWGTPDDVAEYNNWSSIFKRLIQPKAQKKLSQQAVIIPMAGLGSRFVQEGYTTTKPLIPVSGKPMVMQATDDLPHASNYVFVLRQDMPGFETISQGLQQSYPSVNIASIENATEGQACTALIGLNALKIHGNKEEMHIPSISSLITFGACDNGVLYDDAAFQKLVNNLDIDVIVWGVRHHAHAKRHPQMYGWIDEKEGVISCVSVKKPLRDPAIDPIIIGTFTFRRANDFRLVVDRLMTRNGRINNEFYLDSCINDAIDLGLRCHLFEVDHLLSWGTPNDLRTFEYWQSCFHKWASHPYRLELDSRVPKDKQAELDTCYQADRPQRPVNCV